MWTKDAIPFYLEHFYTPALALFGLVAGCLSRYYAPRLTTAGRRRWLIALCFNITVELLTTLTPWSFRAYWVQAADLSLGYVAICVLVGFAIHLHSTPARTGPMEAAILLLFCIIVSSLCHAYLESDPVDSATALGPHVMLLRRSGGMLAQNWEGVKIIQQPPTLPFLERQLYSIRMGETDDCNQQTIHVAPDAAAHTIVVSCGMAKQYIWERVEIP